MPQVILAVSKGGEHDGSIEKQTMKFLYKLHGNDAQPGLHIEPIHGSVDARVRTGRVTQMYRAVLFKVQGSGNDAHYIFTGVWPHDEAIAIAQKARLTVNPVNGTTEMILASETDGSPQAPVYGYIQAVAAPEPVASAAPQTSLLESVSAGTTVNTLIEVLGIEPRLAASAMAATTDDAVIDLAADAVEWQGMALLDLAAGKTIAGVRASLGLDQQTAEEVGDEDEKILAGLKTPAAQMQFAWIEDQEELRLVIEGGDFAKWRVFLHPEQRRYVEGTWNGPFRLSGGAGTGKTVVLLHRARMLARRDPNARVVLTTFTRNLAADMRRNLQLLDAELPLADKLSQPGVFVTGLDSAAAAVRNAATADAVAAAVERVLGVGGNRALQRPTNASNGWKEAIESAGGGLTESLRSPAFFEAEYSLVVLPGRILTKDAYLRVRRPGRGTALNRAERSAVWDVVSSYRASAAVEGVADFPEVVALATELLEASGARPADHVLVDEGQDLAPGQWQLVRALAAEGVDDLFIAEDSQQRIYGQRVVLGRYGIKIVGRSRRLSLNYRTTQQVLRFATGVLEGVPTFDLDEEVTDAAGYRSARSGPVPRRVAASSLTEELQAAASQVQEWIDAGVAEETIGILVRDQRSADQVARGLEDRGVTVRQVTRMAARAKSPQLMTMHRAKGMEFSRVLIFGAEADLMPAAYLLKGVPEGEREDVLLRERALFYVAATRARDELVVMWSGAGSEFVTGDA